MRYICHAYLRTRTTTQNGCGAKDVNDWYETDDFEDAQRWCKQAVEARGYTCASARPVQS